MKNIKKYLFGFLILLITLSLYTSVFAVEQKVNNQNNIKNSSLITEKNIQGEIIAIGDGKYTISTKRGNKIITREVLFNEKTKFQKQKEIKSTKKNLSQGVKIQKIPKIKTVSTDLKVGDIVAIKGQINKDGKIEASSIKAERNQKIKIKKQKN